MGHEPPADIKAQGAVQEGETEGWKKRSPKLTGKLVMLTLFVCPSLLAANGFEYRNCLNGSDYEIITTLYRNARF